MNKKSPSTPDSLNRQMAQSAVVGAIFLTIFGLFSSIGGSLKGSFVSWQDYVLLATPILVFISALISIVLLRRGNFLVGTSLVFIANLLLPIIASLLQVGVGQAVFIYALTSSVTLIWWTIPKTAYGWTIGLSTLVMAFTIAMEWINPPMRVLASAELSAFFYGASVILAVVVLIEVARRGWSGSLRNKLTVTLVGVTLISTSIIGFISNYVSSTNINEQVGSNLAELAAQQSNAIGGVLDANIQVLSTLALDNILQNNVKAANSVNTNDLAELSRLDQQWINASDSDPLISKVLKNRVADNFRAFQEKFPTFLEIFATDQYGAIVASSGRTSDYYQADEGWWQSAWDDGNGQVYISQITFDESSNAFSIDIAIPITAQNIKKPLGILRATIDVNQFLIFVQDFKVGQTGRSDLLFQANQTMTAEKGFGRLSKEDVVNLASLPSTYGQITYEGTSSLVSTALVSAPLSQHKDLIEQLGWKMLVHQNISEAQESVTATTRSILLSAIVLLVLIVFITIYFSRVLSAPIVRLTQTAEKIAGGDIGTLAKVETDDEIGTLASAFNRMTRQLRDLINTLEQRVTERTRNLELAAEVGRTVSQVRALDVMLTEAAELIRKQFDLYYVQVYLTDPSQTHLNLQAGTGQVGEQLLARAHRLPLNTTSINGRAALEKKPVVISNTAANSTFKPNPLLPNTRSEMAVPLIIGDRVVGVLDMQSDHADSLSQNELPAFEALAGQLAIAIQNANFLAETELARAEVEKQAASLVHANWQDYQDAIHKPEQTGFIFDHNKVIPFTEAEEQSQPNTGNSLKSPVAITGETLGMLTVKLGTQSRVSQSKELVNTVARQVAQRIEALRLVESAERYRAEAEAASRRLTREAWKTYAEQAGKHQKYLYDLKEVRPFNYSKADTTATSVPLKIRDEVIGKFGIHGLDPNDQAALELVNAAVERLGAHIESLRQFDQTQSALTQSVKLFEASHWLAQSQDLQGLVKAAVNSLSIPEIDRAVLGALEYGSEGNLEGMTIIANWSRSEKLQATPIGTRYSKEALNTISLLASPDPLFFDDALNDKQIDAATLEIAKQSNYRAVAVLPLHVGTSREAILLFEGEKSHRFTQDEMQLFAALAPQIATVTENRRQFERAQKQAELEAALNIISQKIQGATSVDAVLEIAARELGQALQASSVSAKIETTPQNINKN